MPDILYMQFTMQAYFASRRGSPFRLRVLKEGKKTRRHACLRGALLAFLASWCATRPLTILPFFWRNRAAYKRLAAGRVAGGDLVCARGDVGRRQRLPVESVAGLLRVQLGEVVAATCPAWTTTQTEVFEKAGWSENDYEMFYHWYLVDGRPSRPRSLKPSGDAAGPSLTIPYVIPDFVHDMYSVLIFFPFCILALCLALCLMTRKKHLLPSIVAASAVLVHVGFIILRRAPIRTVYPHYVLGILLLLLLADYTAFRPVLRRRDAKGPSGRRNAFASGWIRCVSMLLMNTASQATGLRRGRTGTRTSGSDRYIGQQGQTFLSSVSARRPLQRLQCSTRPKGNVRKLHHTQRLEHKTPGTTSSWRDTIENHYKPAKHNSISLKSGATLIQQYLLEKFGIRPRRRWSRV